MSDNVKLLNVTVNVPSGYKKSSDNRVILIESKNGNASEVNLDS